MAKLESTMKNMVLSLSMIALVASGLLGGVYALTKGPIDQATKMIKRKLSKLFCQINQP